MTIVPKTKQEVCTVLRYRDKKENERAYERGLNAGWLKEGRKAEGLRSKIYSAADRNSST